MDLASDASLTAVPPTPGKASTRLRLKRFAYRLFWGHPTHLTPVLERYLQERAPEILGGDGPEAHHLTDVVQGRNCVVRGWKHPRFGLVFARAWRYSLFDRPAQDHRIGGELLRAAGVRVPQTLLCDDSNKTIRRYGIEVVIEHAAPGKHPSTADLGTQPLCATLASNLARMHQHECSVWGKAWQPVNSLGDLKAHWRDRIDKWRERIPPDLDGIPREAFERFLDDTLLRLENARFDRPRLVHGDPLPSNLLVDEQGGLSFIDFGTVHWGHPALDLALSRTRLPEETFTDGFARAYRDAGGEPFSEMWEVITLFSRLVTLDKISSRAMRLRRSQLPPERLELYQREKQRYMGRLRSLMAEMNGS